MKDEKLKGMYEYWQKLLLICFQLDDRLLSSPVFKGPVYTPAIKDFFPQDGKYIDKTNYFDDTEVLDFSNLYAVFGKKRK